MSILLALTRQDPANTGWRREFAEAQLEQARQSQVAGQVEVARTQAQAALAILDPLLARQPDDRATLLATVATRLLLADLVGSHDPPAAQQLRSAALKSTAGPDSGDPRLLALQVTALLALDRKAEARPPIRAAVAQRLPRSSIAGGIESRAHRLSSQCRNSGTTAMSRQSSTRLAALRLRQHRSEHGKTCNAVPQQTFSPPSWSATCQTISMSPWIRNKNPVGRRRRPARQGQRSQPGPRCPDHHLATDWQRGLGLVRCAQRPQSRLRMDHRAARRDFQRPSTQPAMATS